MRNVNDLLKKLGVQKASEVTVGKSPAVAGSTNPVIAGERSRELAENPQYFAKTATVDLNITNAEREALIAAGAKKA
jgi:hypothetical protein